MCDLALREQAKSKVGSKDQLLSLPKWHERILSFYEKYFNNYLFATEDNGKEVV